MERSDEARRMDSLQQALGKAERNNIKRADKIEQLEQQIKELKSELEGKEDSAHFVITDLQTKITELERIIVEAKECVKDYSRENDNLKTLLDETINKYNKRMTVAKEQIAILGKEIDQLHSHNRKALEQIWNKLKLVKIHF